jgi:hypothetical protein
MDEKEKWVLAHDKGGMRSGYMTSNMAVQGHHSHWHPYWCPCTRVIKGATSLPLARKGAKVDDTLLYM